MERIEWKFDPADRVREFPEGPWDDEPDKVQWPDAVTGFACMIRRNAWGVWCGYVGVDKTHPWHGRGYSADGIDVEVHGGLTYADACDGDEEHGICHVPAPGEPEPLWWFGFDCGHAFDYSPGMAWVLDVFHDMTYRDQAYVTAEVEGLARQIGAAG